MSKPGDEAKVETRHVAGMYAKYDANGPNPKGPHIHNQAPHVLIMGKFGERSEHFRWCIRFEEDRTFIEIEDEDGHEEDIVVRTQDLLSAAQWAQTKGQHWRKEHP